MVIVTVVCIGKVMDYLTTVSTLIGLCPGVGDVRELMYPMLLIILSTDSTDCPLIVRRLSSAFIDTDYAEMMLTT